jgi:hypothetical protein
MKIIVQCFHCKADKEISQSDHKTAQKRGHKNFYCNPQCYGDSRRMTAEQAEASRKRQAERCLAGYYRKKALKEESMIAYREDFEDKIVQVDSNLPMGLNK